MKWRKQADRKWLSALVAKKRKFVAGKNDFSFKYKKNMPDIVHEKTNLSLNEWLRPSLYIINTADKVFTPDEVVRGILESMQKMSRVTRNGEKVSVVKESIIKLYVQNCLEWSQKIIYSTGIGHRERE